MDYDRLDSGLLAPRNTLKIGGVFTGQILRKGEVIDEFECHNLVPNEGLNHILDVVVHGSTPVTTWYMGVFEGNYTPVVGLTAATVASAATECTAYNGATRPEYVEAAAASQTITNSANRASFVFNASKNIYGAFLVSSSTKGGTSGVLLAAAKFSAVKSVEDDDELLLTYALSIANAS